MINVFILYLEKGRYREGWLKIGGELSLDED